MTYSPLWTHDRAPLQGLGTMRLSPESWGEPDRDPGELVTAAIDEGVTLLDTAELYGTEEILGKAVGARRSEVTLCSKFGVYFGESGALEDFTVDATPANVHRAIDASLRRLGTDVIDLYYLHHRSEETPIEDTVGALVELLDAGKIRAIGLSNVTVDDIRRAHAVHPIQAVQEQWSLTARGVEDMLPVLAELGITLVAHSPIGHGSLAGDGAATVVGELAASHGVTPGQLALAWVHNRGRLAGQPLTPLPGTTRVSNLRANIAAAELVLDEADLAALEASVAAD